ncbi:MAG: NADH-ubiquinone oxidoreductase-F iron-sulfur binding region domain-containing protein, partial [Mycobacterium sp.]
MPWSNSAGVSAPDGSTPTRTTAVRTCASLTVAARPGCTPRLLREHPGREDYGAYRELGGYRPLASADDLLDEVERSGLLGRGGAAFPLATKLRTVRANGRFAGGAVVVANGEEGEPASIKDRWLLRNRPHLVLDGLRLAAAIVAADRAYVYLSDPESARSVEAALAELDAFRVPVDVWTVDPGYIAGEETAAVRALNGGPVKPTDKPPRPFQQGVGGRPTLVSNVETLANLAYLQQHGAAEFRTQGTATSPGTLLMTITGAGRPPVLYEIPHGLPFTELLALHGVSPDQVTGVLMGGYFAGMLNRGVLD